MDGPIRSFTNQLLNGIERDLAVPCTKMGQNKAQQQQVCNMEVDDAETGFQTSSDLDMMMDIDDTVDKSGNAKFSWDISRQAGFIVGRVFGKALQLNIRLPFALGSIFYRLLIDTSDRTIEEYYQGAYHQEISKFRQGIESLFDAGNLEELLQILARPESLRFTRLSTGANDKRPEKMQ